MYHLSSDTPRVTNCGKPYDFDNGAALPECVDNICPTCERIQGKKRQLSFYFGTMAVQVKRGRRKTIRL